MQPPSLLAFKEGAFEAIIVLHIATIFFFSRISQKKTPTFSISCSKVSEITLYSDKVEVAVEEQSF